MGLLDDLKAEAEQVKRSNEDRRSLEARQQAFYLDEIRPALRRGYGYLQELVAQLAVIDRDIGTAFGIPGYKEVPARQVERQLTVDSLENVTRLNVRLGYVVDELRFGVMPLDQAQEARAFFETRRVPFSDWPVRDRDNSIVGLNFLVNEMRIDGGIELLADIAGGCVRLGVYNVQGFGQESSAIAPQRIDDEWLDRLGRYLLCQGDHPERTQLDERVRADLRARIAEEKAAEAEELARLEQEAARLEAESSGRARIENAVRRVLRGVRRRSGSEVFDSDES
ncbi:MAG: hypothetical protein KDI88_01850 [Gammaproteobacteria bacterium]|nr:hypothetical protein [Gammaproteobacteria bacterium]